LGPCCASIIFGTDHFDMEPTMTTTPVPAEERTRQSAHLAAGAQGLAPITHLPPSAIDREWSRHFYLQANVAGLTRTHARTSLTMLRWAGNVEAATTVAAVLAQNTVDHANPDSFGDRSSACLRLALTEAGDLLIDVSDPLPAFPDFGAAVSGARGRGLWQATRLGARLSWFLIDDGDRKTVRAHMAHSPVSA
jgi:hypothetical protein